MKQHPPLTMSLSGPRLRTPSSSDVRADHIYGVPALFQVSPTAAACVLNIRVIGVSQVDFENGADVVVFDSLDGIRPETAIPLVRNEPAVDPATGTRLVLIHHAPNGGFVPLGARLADGRPHPAAGTGFGISVVVPHLEHAPTGATPTTVRSSVGFRLILLQYRYDGRTFQIVSRRRLAGNELLPGWTILNRGLGTAVPDGADLLFGLVAGRQGPHVQAHRDQLSAAGRRELTSAHPVFGECYGSGVSRWQYGPEGWLPVSYVPVTGLGPDMSFEPSLVRDRDGGLLLAVRGKGSNADPGELDAGMENTYEHFRVYRSRDAGTTWERAIHLARMRSPTPVVINRLRNGEPYLAGNPYKDLMLDAKGRKIYKIRVREELMAWPLTADRRGVGAPVMLLDTNAKFGPVRQYDELDHANHWHADHPEGAVVRLRDGQWHSLLGFRVTDTALCGFGVPPPPQAGTWIEEVTCPGESLPAWQFGPSAP